VFLEPRNSFPEIVVTSFTTSVLSTEACFAVDNNQACLNHSSRKRGTVPLPSTRDRRPGSRVRDEVGNDRNRWWNASREARRPLGRQGLWPSINGVLLTWAIVRCGPSALTHGIVPSSSSQNRSGRVLSTERYDLKLYTLCVPNYLAAPILVPRSRSSTRPFPKHDYYGLNIEGTSLTVIQTKRPKRQSMAKLRFLGPIVPYTENTVTFISLNIWMTTWCVNLCTLSVGWLVTCDMW
jgi:hypothetical protein